MSKKIDHGHGHHERPEVAAKSASPPRPWKTVRNGADMTIRDADGNLVCTLLCATTAQREVTAAYIVNLANGG